METWRIHPYLRWEGWRINKIRGWSLHFKRVSYGKPVAVGGVMTASYRVVAKKNGLCAEYQITDTMSFPPNNVQIRPMLVVEPNGVAACR